jgi:hypothetical protein
MEKATCIIMLCSLITIILSGLFYMLGIYSMIFPLIFISVCLMIIGLGLSIIDMINFKV